MSWVGKVFKLRYNNTIEKEEQQENEVEVEVEVEVDSLNLPTTTPCHPVPKVTGIPKPRPPPKEMPPLPYDVCDEDEKVKCPRSPCQPGLVPCCTKKQPPKPLCPPPPIEEKQEWVEERDNWENNPCVAASKSSKGEGKTKQEKKHEGGIGEGTQRKMTSQRRMTTQRRTTTKRQQTTTEGEDELMTTNRQQTIRNEEDELVTTKRQQTISKDEDDMLTTERQQMLTNEGDDMLTTKRQQTISKDEDDMLTTERQQMITNEEDDMLTTKWQQTITTEVGEDEMMTTMPRQEMSTSSSSAADPDLDRTEGELRSDDVNMEYDVEHPETMTTGQLASRGGGTLDKAVRVKNTLMSLVSNLCQHSIAAGVQQMSMLEPQVTIETAVKSEVKHSFMRLLSNIFQQH